MLRCSDGSLYTGATKDIRKRVARHTSGKGSKYTRSRLPVALVYLEEAGNLSQVLKRESKIKKLGRSKKLLLCASYLESTRQSLR